MKTLCWDLDDAISICSKSTTNEEEDEGEVEAEEEDDDGDENLHQLCRSLAMLQYEGLISYCLGVVFGCWDVRFAQNRSLIPKSQDVLDPLPVVPAGSNC